jgi:glycerol-3-phosphate acyltransferase PlsY
MLLFLLPVAGYLVGSISSAILVARLMGLDDPRSVGSGNPGATNILRMGSKAGAAITLAGDMLKGVLPVVAARALSDDALVIAVTGLAAFLGHLYPVFFGFKGGKGVATALGVYLGLNPLLAGAMIATWLLMAAIFRISSLAALTATALSPLYVWLLDPNPVYLVLCFALAVLLFWRHRSNIRKLIDGTEGRIGQKNSK